MPYFRVNPFKLPVSWIEEKFIDKLAKILEDESIIKEQVIAGKKIYYAQYPLGKLLEHTLGIIYVQSRSSMLSALALSPTENDKVLDICSAPGSKTTLLAELMNNKGTLIANEISRDRTKALLSNLDRLGILNTSVINFDGVRIAKYFPEYFDKILVDPPCTALGDTYGLSKSQVQRNINRLNNLIQIQYQLLVASAKMLKIGGEIVYSTCTTTLEENEYLIDKFIKKFPFDVIEVNIEGINIRNEIGKSVNPLLFHSIRIDPSHVDEGFFIVKLKKKDFFEDKSEKRIKTDLVGFNEFPVYNFESGKIKEILFEISDNYGIDNNFWMNFLYVKRNNDIYFVSKSDFDFFRCKVIRAGVKLASYDKKSGWRLSTDAVQILGGLITKNVLVLENKEQFHQYFLGYKTKIHFPDSDFVSVKFKDYFIGSGKVKNGELLSYFPRSKRSIEINFDLIIE